MECCLAEGTEEKRSILATTLATERSHTTLKTKITDKLIEEATDLLENWARRKDIVTGGERLVVTIRVKESPIVALDFEDETAVAELDVRLSTSIDEYEFSPRVRGTLKFFGVSIIGSVARRTEADLRKWRKIGNKSVREIMEKLESQALCLGLNYPVGPREREAALAESFRAYAPWGLDFERAITDALEAAGVVSNNDFLAKTKKEIISLLQAHDRPLVRSSADLGLYLEFIRRALGKRRLI
ncbi:MAG: Bacterial polymerase, alpha chain terminal domain [Candidatus Parcubacteria bacterium]|jgi:hypothetical protein|nr:Bacterial polymerase, alpha chain terminal domain [Candidatus Parcubacteria bacterium]